MRQTDILFVSEANLTCAVYSTENSHTEMWRDIYKQIVRLTFLIIIYSRGTNIHTYIHTYVALEVNFLHVDLYLLRHLFLCTMQEGFSALWRGTNAGLALAVPTVSFEWLLLKYQESAYHFIVVDFFFKIEFLFYQLELFVFKQVGIYLPCYDIFRNQLEEFTTRNAPGLTPYTPLVAGSLARSLACISCYPIELARTRMQVLTYQLHCYLHHLSCCASFSLNYFIIITYHSGI